MDIPRIMDELIKFRDDRDWEQYHTTKNLTTSICVRAAHLLDIFQWMNDEEITEFVKQEKDLVEEKLADILIFIFYLCRNLAITDNAIETAIYCRLLKESTNYQLTDSRSETCDHCDSKIVPLKHK